MSDPATAFQRFLLADWPDQRTLLRDPDTADAVRRHYGDAVFASLERLAREPQPAHLSASAEAVLFVPGVMGSTLQSEGLGGIWWLDMIFARDKLDALRLSPDGESDADPLAKILPATTDVLYAPFRQALGRSAFGQSLPCPYDWRKPIRLAAITLRDRVRAAAADHRRVHLVAHSMGGLVVREALARYGDELWPLVGRIVFIGTPHHGSPSIAGYLKKHLWGFEMLAILGMYLSPTTFRSLRGVLSLLPAPLGVYPGSDPASGTHPCANFDLYDAAAWRLDLSDAETAQLQGGLNDARAFHEQLHAAHEALLQPFKDRMLMIAGVGQTTLFRLTFDERWWAPSSTARRDTERVPGDPDREGDGRVPLASACLPDVETRYVDGVHGALTDAPGVFDDVLAWLEERPLTLARTPADALGGHLSAAASAPLEAPPADALRPRFDELPDYEQPSPALRQRIDAQLARGELPDIHRTRLL